MVKEDKHELSLLFVDDEDNIRLTLPPIIERFGFKVTVAASVPEALSLIGERKFDVLIADLNIGHPGDGFAVVSAMRSTQPNAVRFILTGYPAFDSALEAIRQQVDDFFVKPTDTADMVQRIRAKLGKRTPAELLPSKRLPDVIENNRPALVEHFLSLCQEDTEICSIILSDEERTDHIPRLLEVAVRVARDGDIGGEDREASAAHGRTRRRQGYSIPLLIRDSRLLKRSVASCLQSHLLEINISYLIRDLMAVFGTIDTLLEESSEAFLSEPETSSLRTAGKKRRTG